ncbi:MAG: phosphomethylpyrimidine synthase ThiC, partial [Desulfamplus sp.]|nr:phosphomethylpyrimidine synthase ThiC [Desulfamplus sp.]
DMRWDDLEKYLLFPEIAKKMRAQRSPSEDKTCTMCGDFCAMKRCLMGAVKVLFRLLLRLKSQKWVRLSFGHVQEMMRENGDWN